MIQRPDITTLVNSDDARRNNAQKCIGRNVIFAIKEPILYAVHAQNQSVLSVASVLVLGRMRKPLLSLSTSNVVGGVVIVATTTSAA